MGDGHAHNGRAGAGGGGVVGVVSYPSSAAFFFAFAKPVWHFALRDQAIFLSGFSAFSSLAVGWHTSSLSSLVFGVRVSLWSRSNALPIRIMGSRGNGGGGGGVSRANLTSNPTQTKSKEAWVYGARSNN